MKARATGLLGVAAVVWLLTFLGDGERGWLGYVRAAAEAGMVGGLADWFAVTALFRHPLGIPLPHTALVPQGKDRIAGVLGDFVTGNFLSQELVQERLTAVRLVPRVGARLADPQTALPLAGQLTAVAADLLDALPSDALAGAALSAARRDLGTRSCAPLLGRLLAQAVDGGTHRPLVDVLVSRAHGHLSAHRDVVHRELKAWMEGRGLLLWVVTTDRRVEGLVDGAQQWLAEVRDQPWHPARAWLEDLLTGLAEALQHDPQTGARVDGALRELLEDPRTLLWLRGVLDGATASLRAGLAERDGDLTHRLAELLSRLGTRLVEDAAFAARTEAAVSRAVRYAVDHYAPYVSTHIRDTVAQWPAEQAAEVIEDAVGRDLQFVRINGTLVGALAGLAIHAVATGLG